VRFVLCSISCLSLCITVGGQPFCWATVIHKLRHKIEHKTKLTTPRDSKTRSGQHSHSYSSTENLILGEIFSTVFSCMLVLRIC